MNDPMIKRLFDDPEVKEAIENENLDVIYSKCSQYYRMKLTQIFHDMGIDPIDYVTVIKSDMLPEDVTDLVIPGHIKEIQIGAFFNNPKLKSIVVPATIKKIHSGAFANCRIKSFDWPTTCPIIPAKCFNRCKSLTAFDVPQGTLEIEAGAFEGCSKLASVNLPRSLVEVSQDAFISCKSLSTLNYAGTKAEWEKVGPGVVRPGLSVTCTDGIIEYVSNEYDTMEFEDLCKAVRNELRPLLGSANFSNSYPKQKTYKYLWKQLTPPIEHALQKFGPRVRAENLRGGYGPRNYQSILVHIFK